MKSRSTLRLQPFNPISIILSLLLLLTACGGGGGNGSPAPTVPSSVVGSSLSSSSSSSSKAPAPTLSITNTEQKIKVGESGSISITTTNATSCSEPVLGAIPVNGSVDVTPIKGGRATYTISCSGDGGVVTKDALVITPFPVYKTSYENKVNALLVAGTHTASAEVVSGDIEEDLKASGSYGFNNRTVAFADFLQNGTMVALVESSFYKNLYPEFNLNKWPDSPSKYYFIQENAVTKKWEDVSSELFKDDNRYNCATAGFAAIADLNNDEKPDVMVACNGPDFPLANNDWSNTLSDQYILLSQIDGTYKNVKLSNSLIYSHQLSLADVDGDGNVDILTTNSSVDSVFPAKPLVYWGNGDGTFSMPDSTVFPDEMLGSPIYALTAIPIGEKINVIISGANPNNSYAQYQKIYGTKVFQFIDGKFENVNDFSSVIPNVPTTDFTFEFAINAAYYNNHWVLLLVNSDPSGNDIYGAVVTVDSDGKNVKILKVIDESYLPCFNGEFNINADKGTVVSQGSSRPEMYSNDTYCGMDISLGFQWITLFHISLANPTAVKIPTR